MAYLVLFGILQFLCALLSSSAGSPKVPQGFVTTNNGNQFELDGKPFAFIGANAYWLPLLTSAQDVEATFQEMQGAGVKVLRTWGFNAINASELAGALKSNLTYYQLWNSSDWILNDGPQGLQRLDYVVQVAGKYDIKIILTLTNNWVGYGGSDLYISWIAGADNTHDVFYTDPRIISSFQRYISTIVQRYKNSPTIFGFEIMNEARCLSDTFPSGPACVPGTELLTKWYKQQSEFIRSLDPFHMITTGGEGHFYWKKHPVSYWSNGTLVSDYNFNGQAGEDFDVELQTLDEIDFGTYHLYPQTWYPELDYPGSNFSVEQWGLDWIQSHANAAKRANKPVILEEFGLSGIENKSAIYPIWVKRALDTQHGIIPWQFGMLGLKEDGGNRLIKYSDMILNGASPNDGFAIYKNQTSVWDIFTHAAQIQASRSG